MLALEYYYMCKCWIIEKGKKLDIEKDPKTVNTWVSGFKLYSKLSSWA